MGIFRRLAKKLSSQKDLPEYEKIRRSLDDVKKIREGLDSLLFPLIELLGCDNPHVKIEVIKTIRDVFKNQKDELLIPMMYELVNETNFEVKFYTSGIIQGLKDKRILPTIEYVLNNYKKNYFNDFEHDLFGRDVCKNAMVPWLSTLTYIYAEISGQPEDEVYRKFGWELSK